MARRPQAPTPVWEEFGQLLWSSPGVGVAVWDEQCRYVAINDELASVNGLAPHAHVGRTPAEVLPAEHAVPLTALVNDVLRGGDVVGLELTDAERVWETVWLRRRAEEAPGEPAGARVMCLAVDVTHERDPVAGDRPGARSARWSSRLLAAVSALSSAGSDASSLTGAVTEVVTAMGASGGMVGIVEPEELVFRPDLSAPQLDGPLRISLTASRSPAAHAARSGSAMWLPDSAALAASGFGVGLLPGPIAHEQAWALLPLLAPDGDAAHGGEPRVIGVLRLSWQRRQEFAATQRTFLEAAAEQVAHTLSRVLLAESEHRAQQAAMTARERTGHLLTLAQHLTGVRTTAEVADHVWQALVPFGALGGGLGLLDREARLLRVAAGWGGVRWPDQRLSSRLPFVAAATEGRWVEVDREQMEQISVSAAQWMHQAGSHLARAVPLEDGGRVVGSLAVHLAAGEVGDEQREYLQTVAALAGQALARAAAQEQAEAALVQLQHALLPARLEQTPGIRPHAGFRASRVAGEVGGDFYDVVALPDAGAVLLLGDVEGHDLAASAVMGQLRAVMRAHALEGLSPAEILTRADAFLTDIPEGRLATVVVAELRPDSHLLVLSSAGHPPGVIVDGAARLLQVPPDPPLGLGYPRRRESLLPLPGRARLLFYTDGLVETRGGDIDAGLAALVRRVEQLAHVPLADAVERLLESADSDTGDDAAVLLVDLDPVQPVDGSERERRVPPNRRNVHLTRHWAHGALRHWAVDEGTASSVDLVLAELLANAVRVADADIHVRLCLTGSAVLVEVRDDSPREPRLQPADAQQGHGRGLTIVAALAEHWGVRWHDDAGKTVWASVLRDTPRTSPEHR